MKLYRIFYSKDGAWKAGAAVSSESKTALQGARLADHWAVCEECSGVIGEHVGLDSDGRGFIDAWCHKRAEDNGRNAGKRRLETGDGPNFVQSPYDVESLADAWRDGFESVVTPCG
ncbi:MAG: hypothetical protein V3R83_09990 [Gammaproteobacteria bacterium]